MKEGKQGTHARVTVTLRQKGEALDIEPLVDVSHQLAAWERKRRVATKASDGFKRVLKHFPSRRFPERRHGYQGGNHVRVVVSEDRESGEVTWENGEAAGGGGHASGKGRRRGSGNGSSSSSSSSSGNGGSSSDGSIGGSSSACSSSTIVVAMEGSVSVSAKPRDSYQSRKYLLLPSRWRALPAETRDEITRSGVVSMVYKKGVVTVRHKSEPFKKMKKQKKKRRTGGGDGGEGDGGEGDDKDGKGESESEDNHQLVAELAPLPTQMMDFEGGGGSDDDGDKILATDAEELKRAAIPRYMQRGQKSRQIFEGTADP